MFPAQRRAKILELVRAENSASINELAARLGISGSTIRRDLELLTHEGYLQRSHGGVTIAAMPRTMFEADQDISANIFPAQKAAIGAVAASLVQSGQSLIIDSGSTTLQAARWIVERDLNVTIVTNDLRIADLASRAGKPIMVTGGSVRQRYTLVGEPGSTFAGGLHADVVLIGIHSLAGHRLSETSVELAALKKTFISSARRSAVLADSSKFKEPAFATVCGIGDVDYVITDDGIAADLVAEMRAMGVNVLVAKV